MEIDIELAPSDQTTIPKSKEQAERDAGNQLHMLTNRHDKFLDSLREVKVKFVLLNPACTLSLSSESILTKLRGMIHLTIILRNFHNDPGVTTGNIRKCSI